jgi:hypothetical protein
MNEDPKDPFDPFVSEEERDDRLQLSVMKAKQRNLVLFTTFFLTIIGLGIIILVLVNVMRTL